MKSIKDLFISGKVPVFVEIRGRSTLLSQGHFRICDYSPEYISLEGEEYTVSVSGDGLTLRHLSEDTIAIDGRIDKVEFI